MMQVYMVRGSVRTGLGFIGLQGSVQSEFSVLIPAESGWDYGTCNVLKVEGLLLPLAYQIGMPDQRQIGISLYLPAPAVGGGRMG